MSGTKTYKEMNSLCSNCYKRKKQCHSYGSHTNYEWKCTNNNKRGN